MPPRPSSAARKPELKDDFDLEVFVPYLLNQAAEATSRGFQAHYRAEYGLTRAQWRVMAHLGRFGAMTAAEICRRTMVEKTKISRAVAALEERGLLVREKLDGDRRSENLRLTRAGRGVYAALGRRAVQYGQELESRIGKGSARDFVRILRLLANAAGTAS
jgi:DNA-binding MarR family transcriptional regulator